MPELLQTYSIEQIIIFVVILAISVKGLINFYDWAKERLNVIIKNREKKEELREKVNKMSEIHKKDMDDLFKIQDVQNEAISKLTDSVNLLLDSDRDEIKAWITEKHHYYVYELKEIDDYSLNCIEKRYAHYVEEKGNSFVADLMKDIRSLKVVSMHHVDKEK